MGVFIQKLLSDLPASINRTLCLPDELSLSARTHPAEPAPTIIKS